MWESVWGRACSGCRVVVVDLDVGQGVLEMELNAAQDPLGTDPGICQQHKVSEPPLDTKSSQHLYPVTTYGDPPAHSMHQGDVVCQLGTAVGSHERSVSFHDALHGNLLGHVQTLQERQVPEREDSQRGRPEFKLDYGR